MRTFKRILLPFLLLVFTPFSLESRVVIPISLEQNVRNAKIIFQGRCKEVEKTEVEHPQSRKAVPAKNYIFEIQDVLRGDVGSVFELKQLDVHTLKEAHKYGFYSVPASSDFKVGGEYLLILGSETKFGTRSVLGEEQGKYLLEEGGVSKGGLGENIVEQVRKIIDEKKNN